MTMATPKGSHKLVPWAREGKEMQLQQWLCCPCPGGGT